MLSTESESTSGRESTETSGSDDSQPGGHTPPSQFRIVELPVLQVPKNLSKGWPFKLGPRTHVSGAGLLLMRGLFKIPPEIELRAATRGSTFLTEAPPGFVSFNMAYFDAGVRLRLHPFLTEFLCHTRFSPGNLAPNVYASLLGFIILCRVYSRVEPDLNVFMGLYAFRWRESAVYCTAPMSRRILIDLPTSNKGWKGRHFYVGGQHRDISRAISVDRKIGTCYRQTLKT